MARTLNYDPSSTRRIPPKRPGSATAATIAGRDPAGSAAGRAFAISGRMDKVIRSRRQLARIRALVIPPAWTDVWICADPRGHLQATGRDARGRKQYRYHAKWRAGPRRDEIRSPDRVCRGAARDPQAHEPAISRTSHLSREKVLAAVVQLLEKTLIRVGNDEYAKENQSFGLTTMRDAHVEVSGTRVRFPFRGKSGVEHEIDLDDRRLARTVRAVPRHSRLRAVSVLRRGRQAAGDRVGRRERVSQGDHAARTTRRRTSARGPGPCWRRSSSGHSRSASSDAEAKRNIVEAVEWWPSALGTRRPSAARATSTRRCSTTTSRAR